MYQRPTIGVYALVTFAVGETGIVHARQFQFLTMFRITLLHLCFFCLSHSNMFSQDTLLMRKEVAGENLLTGRQQLDKVPKSSLATGELMELDLTGQPIYIITSEEILRQNISTLSDVFRLIPGAVISQVGSAVEGEKIMIQGLSGNSQMKILINGVPVKPWSAGGMPIGSQLPIRQADRVEVLLGSASSLYGEEACAGVVNIVLEESERPVFTRTNLGFGRFGYNDLDLTFGGKLGKDRNIFKFTVYGRSTVQSDRDIFYAQNKLYNFRDYLLYPNITPIWERNDNLFPLGASRDSIVPIFGAPHESRQFGVMLVWRGVRFRYDLMSRRDYSSLGLNPMAASYRRPGDRIGERIETFSAQFGRSRKRRQSNLLLSVLRYSTTENSLKTHVFGAMGQTFYQNLKRDFPPNFNEKLYNRLFETYYNGQRNVVNEGLDARLNYRISYALMKGLTWSSGFVNSIQVATQYSDLFNRAAFSSTFIPESDTSGLIKPFKPEAAITLMGTHFHQLAFKRKHYSLFAGVAGHFILEHGAFFTKRFGGVAKIDNHISLDGNYGEGFSPISPYYLGGTVLLTRDENTTFQASQSNSDFDIFRTQRSHTYDLGVRGKWKGLSSRVSLFGSKQNRVIEGGYVETGSKNWGVDTSYILYGYMTDAGAFTQVRGLRIEAIADSTRISVLLNKKDLSFRWTQNASIQVNNGRRQGIADSSGNRIVLDYVPNYARWNFKYGTSMIWKKFDLSFIYQLQAPSYTNLDLYRHRFPTLANRSNVTSGRRTLDVSARIFLNKNFSAWIDLRNALNRKFDGIDAYGTPDDLITNPQAGRTLRFGVQYNLD